MANELIALVDLDGTLADFDGAMKRDMSALASPGEDIREGFEYFEDGLPEYLRARRNLIKSMPGWWCNLKPLWHQFEVLKLFRKYSFGIHILTKGPFRDANAWKEKVEWCKEHVPDAQITITMDKGLVYGKVLMDDYPPYIERWLQWRPRGTVIMPVRPYNEDFRHDQVIHYIGSSFCLERIEKKLQEIVGG